MTKEKLLDLHYTVLGSLRDYKILCDTHGADFAARMDSIMYKLTDGEYGVAAADKIQD